MTTDMEILAEAFRVLGQIVRLNGRRRDRAQAEIRMRLLSPEQFNKARVAPMRRRAERRARIVELRQMNKELTKKEARDKFFFRPVLGYVGAGEHKDFRDAVEAMKYSWLHRNDKKLVGEVIPNDSQMGVQP